MPRASLRLKSSPKFLSNNSSQAVSLGNVGISGDTAHSAIAFFRTDSVAIQTILGFGSLTGTGTGWRLRILSGVSVDLNITGIGSVPVTLSRSVKGMWCSVGMKKAAGSSSWFLLFNGVPVNGSSATTVNITDGPLYMGANQSGGERLDGNISLSGAWNSFLSDPEFLTLHKQGLAALNALAKPKIFYRMDDGVLPLDPRVLRDISDSANHAVLTGTHWVAGETPWGVRAPAKTPTSPFEIPGAMALYEADQGITMDGSNRVSQWNDFSGAGSHLLQATAGTQPLYVANGINSRPAVRITNARADAMVATNGIFGGGARPHTIACVIKAESGGLSAFQGFFAIGSGGAGGNTSSLGVDNTNVLWYGGAGLGVPTVPQTFTNGETYIMIKRSNGAQDTVWLNSTQRGSAPQISTYTITPIGDILFGKYTAAYTSANFLCSFMGAWNRDLSNGEVRALINYLASRYGVGTVAARSTAGVRSTASGRSLAT